MSSQLVSELLVRPDLTRPRWDQRTFEGRAKHFFVTTNPLNLFIPNRRLEEAKKLVLGYRKGVIPSGLTVDELWRSQHIFDSAYHPVTNEMMFFPGRMCAQVPFNMALAGGMLTFYKSPMAVIFWQWLNQSFNAVVNYTNRSGGDVPAKQLYGSYVCATGGAVFAALGLNSLVKSAPPLVGRLVPFCAVAVANAINIPMMRSQELYEGIELTDENDKQIGYSRKAARKAIIQVTICRNLMAAPTFVCIPIAMNSIVKTKWYQVRPWVSAPLQAGIAGLVLAFAMPLCCALFPQRSAYRVKDLEPELQQRISALPKPPSVVYYNKGL